MNILEKPVPNSKPDSLQKIDAMARKYIVDEFCFLYLLIF